MTAERGATSKDRLKIDWQHPVPPVRDSVRTSAAGALPLEQALKVLWEDDPRPMLVLRECTSCQDSDVAVLSRSMNNDRTLLLTKWFRTVRLPPHVTDPNHAFHNVFAGFSFKRSPHFYLLAHPGAQPVEFTGQQTQSSLWSGMHSVLSQRYAGDPVKAVKEWLSLLDRFDRLDQQLKSMQEQLDQARASGGPDSAQARGLEKRLANARKEHSDALAREAQVRNLGFLPMPEPVAPKVADAAGAQK